MERLINSKKFKRLCQEYEERQKKREEHEAVCIDVASYEKAKKEKGGKKEE